MEHESDLETTRSACFDLAAAAFSASMFDLDRYEAFAGEIAGARDLGELQTIKDRLPPIPAPTPPRAQLIQTESSVLKRSGQWLDSSRIKLYGKSSNIKLDFTDYDADDDLRIELDLDCRSSSIRIIVPSNIDVVDRISSSRMSVLRDRRRKASTNSAIILTGNLEASRIKIKRKRRTSSRER